MCVHLWENTCLVGGTERLRSSDDGEGMLPLFFIYFWLAQLESRNAAFSLVISIQDLPPPTISTWQKYSRSRCTDRACTCTFITIPQPSFQTREKQKAGTPLRQNNHDRWSQRRLGCCQRLPRRSVVDDDEANDTTANHHVRDLSCFRQPTKVEGCPRARSRERGSIPLGER